MQRPAIPPGADLLVGLPRLGQRPLLGQRDHAVQRLVVALEAVQVHLRQGERRDLPCPQPVGQVGQRRESGGFEVSRRRRDGRLVGPGRRGGGGRRGYSGDARVEHQGQRHAVIQRHGAQGFVVGKTLLHVVQHQLVLGVGKGQPNHALGGGQHGGVQNGGLVSHTVSWEGGEDIGRHGKMQSSGGLSKTGIRLQ